MHKMNLTALDLNLLKVFDAVYQTGNVTKAAERLYLSQPAVSHALSRLRHTLKDELFVKVPGGVQPTHRAMELATPVNEALNLLQRAVHPPKFEPREAKQIFCVATHDYSVATLMPRVIHQMQRKAPYCSVRLRPTEGRALEMLDNQEADMAISAFGELPERFERQLIMQDDYVCLAAKNHNLAQQTVTLKEFSQARHLLVSPKGDERGFIDTLLAKQGLTRHIAMIINQFTPAGNIVASSDLIVTLPRRLAMQQVQQFDLQWFECPLEAPDAYVNTSVVWHRRLGQDPGFSWFRALLMQLGQESLTPKTDIE